MYTYSHAYTHAHTIRALGQGSTDSFNVYIPTCMYKYTHAHKIRALGQASTDSFQSSTYSKSQTQLQKAKLSMSGAHHGSTDEDEGLEEFLRMKDMEALAKKESLKEKVGVCVCVYVYVYVCMCAYVYIYERYGGFG